MPHLGDIPEETDAREFGVDNAVDGATCCVPGRDATGGNFTRVVRLTYIGLLSPAPERSRVFRNEEFRSGPSRNKKAAASVGCSLC